LAIRVVRFFIQKIELIVGEQMSVKAIYESNVLKPLEKLNLKEGEVVEIEIKKDAVDRLGGLVKISRQDWIEELIESPELEPI
jgi:predicted DNA-binding antitoxin AbrB/MazE fold protein